MRTWAARGRRRRAAEATPPSGAAALDPRPGPLPSGPLRVVFLVHLPEAWDGIAALIEALHTSDDFVPVVVSIPRRFNGDAAFGNEEAVHRFLTEERVAHERITVTDIEDGTNRLRALEPDVVFRQSQWDADVPPAFATERLRWVRTALVPYETMNIVRNVAQTGTDNSAVDSPYHRDAWLVCCANDLVLAEARRASVRRGEQFRVVGHPKADRLRAALPAWPVARADGTAAARIAWSAHHSIATNWTGFGAFPAMAPAMLRWAQEEPGRDFVFLPHPALVSFLHRPESPMRREEYDTWLEAWRGLPNTAVSRFGRYTGVLAASDLLVTDGLSLLVECQVLPRPIVFVERAGHRPFNAIGEIVREGVHAVATVAEARARTEDLIGGSPDPLAACQRANVATLFGDTPSVPRIMRALRELVDADRARGSGR